MEKGETSVVSFLLTVAAGKRLIAKAVCALPQIKRALAQSTVVVLAGTTNGYVAEELMRGLGREDFCKKGFYRGVTVAPGQTAAAKLDGDLVIDKGKVVTGKTIFDVAGDLGQGDVIVKGANAVDADHGQAGVLIANPAIGTSGPILQAVVGRRAELVIPVGLEKRIDGSIAAAASLLNAPDAAGLRLLPITGTIVTEIEAIGLLTGASASLVAGGGVCGAEGSCWLAVSGDRETLDKAAALYREISREPAFET